MVPHAWLVTPTTECQQLLLAFAAMQSIRSAAHAQRTSVTTFLPCRNDQHVIESQQQQQQQQHPGSMLAAAVLAAAVLSGQPNMALAAEEAATTTGNAAVPTAYFGNGCFW
jgi:hypothetical protein